MSNDDDIPRTVYVFLNADRQALYIGQTFDMPSTWNHHKNVSRWWPYAVELQAVRASNRTNAKTIEQAFLNLYHPPTREQNALTRVRRHLWRIK
jgi:hypothetical protein